MFSLGDVVKYLYTHLLLRDVFAKIVPGMVVLAGIAVGFSGKGVGDLVKEINELPTSVILALTAATWTLGFVAQEFGSLLGVLRRSEAAQMTFPRGPLWVYNEKYRPKAMQLRMVLAKTQRNLEEDDASKRERIIIILEASGNLCCALILFAAGWFLGHLRGHELVMQVDVVDLVILTGLIVLLFLRHRRASGLVEEFENLLEARMKGDSSRIVP